MIDETRANHFVNRVIGPNLAATSGQPNDALENFEERRRDGTATLQVYANAMEQALASHLGKQGEINVI
jgi:hypothetical protein